MRFAGDREEERKENVTVNWLENVEVFEVRYILGRFDDGRESFTR